MYSLVLSSTAALRFAIWSKRHTTNPVHWFLLTEEQNLKTTQTGITPYPSVGKRLTACLPFYCYHDRIHPRDVSNSSAHRFFSPKVSYHCKNLFRFVNRSTLSAKHIFATTAFYPGIWTHVHFYKSKTCANLKTKILCRAGASTALHLLQLWLYQTFLHYIRSRSLLQKLGQIDLIRFVWCHTQTYNFSLKGMYFARKIDAEKSIHSFYRKSHRCE